MIKLFTKNKAIDKRKKEVRINEAIEMGLLPISKKTIIRYIYATKRGEGDFPFRQYTPGGDYFIPIDELLEWKERHGKG